MEGKFRFAIDRGGTFTDFYAECPDGRVKTLKLLSVDPTNYQDAPREGIRRIMEEVTQTSIPKTKKISCDNIEWIRMGTTIATNALLERKGERMALVINKGFKDLLYIGNQARPKIFDLEINMPDVLYEDVVEIDCRVVPEMKGVCLMTEALEWKRMKCNSGEVYLCKQKLDEGKLKSQLSNLLCKGITSIAVVLMHSYMCHEHELQVGALAESLGFTNISLSHKIMPMCKIVNRGYTACADAYLTPHIKQYVKGFASGFKDDLKDVNVLFMQSDGGLTPMTSFNGSRAVLSGPAGGVVGYSKTTIGNKPIIGFDMGGTSTDVSRVAGEFEHVFESTIAGVTIQAPQLDINTVAAGGGSRLFFRSGLFVVGPESAGAHPGPICYRKGGYLTVTDANLILGRIVPDFFPKIFGPDENQPLDVESAINEFKKLRTEVNAFLSSQGNTKELTIEEIAMGFIRVANESMCRPIRALTEGKGYDTRDHVLACFGGAGGQHACAIARELGIQEVAVHKYAGILSAYGIACADVVHEEQEPSTLVFEKANYKEIQILFARLKSLCAEKLKSQGFPIESIICHPYLNMRYEGTDGTLMCSPKHSGKLLNTLEDFMFSFKERYKTEFGFTLKERNVIIDDVRVRGIGVSSVNETNRMIVKGFTDKPEAKTKVYFESRGYLDTNIYYLNKLSNGKVIDGPAIIMDGLSTLVIDPQCKGTITELGDVIVKIDNIVPHTIGKELDPIQLSIFSHRFMSIAEQMGRLLQRTAISTNIKERLDFSCALFGPDGGLVSNAPHIPVHLGSMQNAVQYQLNALRNQLREGDVILSNHPKAGGSHLPDLTVITPVFFQNKDVPAFFVAARGHHADIGGITPGSMPPHSISLLEEGASFKSFFLVRDGEFKEQELINELMKPSEHPGSSGTRNLQDNIADLKAQIAANHKGTQLVIELINTYGLEVIQCYMNYIQDNASLAVQDLLKKVGNRELEKQGTTTLTAEDFLDDGSPIRLEVKIDKDKGTAVFDFSGSGHEVWGNCNAPKAITYSAIIYCLRSMVGHDIPLNQGCLAPVKIIIRPGSILDPSDDAAVVGGNVQTSQRIVDVIFKAFRACAASQGCMNNITFGQSTWGYYETVAGGAGAGPTWHGRSGVHTHMTNTRITDPELLEIRYPVILETFTLRENSGGNGCFKGGNGVNRKLLFRNNIALSILTERRTFHPYGIEGGLPGAKGENLMYKKDGKLIYLGSKTAINVQPGDIFQLLTPGGGGWGTPSETKRPLLQETKTQKPENCKRMSVSDFHRR